MVRPIHLNRFEDVNQTSGTGKVWSGCIFSNNWVAGIWNSTVPTYGWYPSLEHVEKIHGHEGKTQIVFDTPTSLDDGRQRLLVVTEAELTVDGIPWVAEGMMFSSGWIALLHFAKYTSVYWYRSLPDLQYICGKRSQILTGWDGLAIFPSEHPVWEREKIFKV